MSVRLLDFVLPEVYIITYIKADHALLICFSTVYIYIYYIHVHQY